MAFELKWGNKTWIYALALGLGIGLSILLLFNDMIGAKWFWNYYSPMLGYYVLISICQSHYFKRKPEPNMSGMFRQFASIFGAIVIFFVNEALMISIFDMSTLTSEGLPHALLFNGQLIMDGHFTFIVFGFFIYGFDDFMFKGKLLGWMKSDTAKAFFLYFFIWLVWGVLFYSDFGISKAHSWKTYDALAHNRMLAISQWVIIMSLLYALIFKDWIPVLQEKLKIKNDYAYGLILLGVALAIGAVIAYLLFFIAPSISPEGYDSIVADPGLDADTDMWHHVLYMGTFPLIPAILIGVYTKNFSHIEDPGKRVARRVPLLIGSVIVLYFAYHWLIARPEVLINFFFDDAVEKGFGIFGRGDKNWYHQLGLYFNFTVSIIPLTHHWFCGRAGFLKEVEDEPPEEDVPSRIRAKPREQPQSEETPPRRRAKPREEPPQEESDERPVKRAERRGPRESNGSRQEGRKSRREWR